MENNVKWVLKETTHRPPIHQAAIYKTITSNVLSMFTQYNLRLLHTVCTYVWTYRLPIVYIYSQGIRFNKRPVALGNGVYIVNWQKRRTQLTFRVTIKPANPPPPQQQQTGNKIQYCTLLEKQFDNHGIFISYLVMVWSECRTSLTFTATHQQIFVEI